MSTTPGQVQVVRPAVIGRKVSGGTRSAAGSRTRMPLQSLFATWAAQGQDRLEACRQLLITQTPSASTP
ncbi:MAG: hypothetical protein IT210_01275 [Armatimonadetes bacterium]|nr:hypothetical protein [Armatimonadota bacterium]